MLAGSLRAFRCYPCPRPPAPRVPRQGHALLVESAVGGRPVSIVRLARPLRAAGFAVGCVEVPSPKAGSPYPSGLEHCELAVREPPRDFAARCAARWAVGAAGGGGGVSGGVAFDYRAAGKAVNPDVSVVLRGGGNAPAAPFPALAVKFHEAPIHEVVARELAEAAAAAAAEAV